MRAVLMTEWLTHADVARSVNKLRVWLPVDGCTKMTHRDLQEVLSDCANKIYGHSEKVHGAEADRLQLVKVCSQAHQNFMFASDEAFPKVVNGAVAENLGACHQD